MEGNAVKEIAQLARAEGQKIEIAGVEYFAHGAHLINPDEKPFPAPDPLVVSNLSGLRDYVLANRDALELESECMVQVVSPQHVRVVSMLVGHNQQRFVYAEAKLHNRMKAFPGFEFGKWLDPQDMMIAVMALFESKAERPLLIEYLANMKAEGLRQTGDDGASQSVAMRSGIQIGERVTIKNPLDLAPYRTFEELDQPVGPFVFRVREGGRTGIEAALFEADGGAWREDATEQAREWLRAELPEGIAIIA